jgi:twitching motility protein PilT
LINRERAHYIITLEREVRLVHEHRHALISQRQLTGDDDQQVAQARAALRERPDVLVIEDLASAAMFELALQAAHEGLLVIVSVAAPSAATALARVIELFAEPERARIRALLAERLRGAVGQVLLRKVGGGRVAARELLLMTGDVAAVLTHGQLSDLRAAIENGRKYGLMTLTDSLVRFMRSRLVDLREAYRRADDRDALLAALRRENVDVSAVERLA